MTQCTLARIPYESLSNVREALPVIAALFVERGGCYWNLDGVDAWDISRDARLYAGPHPVVAHPECQRWGRYHGGSPCKPYQYKLGDDGGIFAAALAAVRRFGGVLEHPKDSHAWAHFGLNKPPREGGWVKADDCGGWTCCVEQGFYGHLANKPTWLYATNVDLPQLRWGKGEQRIHPRALELHGYEKARRIGMMAMVGGKDKTRIRNATPPDFRDVLLSIARSYKPSETLSGARAITGAAQAPVTLSHARATAIDLPGFSAHARLRRSREPNETGTWGTSWIGALSAVAEGQ
jgi:hypothetical protein